jgi:hypothetical protein
MIGHPPMKCTWNRPIQGIGYADCEYSNNNVSAFAINLPFYTAALPERWVRCLGHT